MGLGGEEVDEAEALGEDKLGSAPPRSAAPEVPLPPVVVAVARSACTSAVRGPPAAPLPLVVVAVGVIGAHIHRPLPSGRDPPRSAAPEAPLPPIVVAVRFIGVHIRRSRPSGRASPAGRGRRRCRRRAHPPPAALRPHPSQICRAGSFPPARRGHRRRRLQSPTVIVVVEAGGAGKDEGRELGEVEEREARWVGGWVERGEGDRGERQWF